MSKTQRKRKKQETEIVIDGSRFHLSATGIGEVEAGIGGAETRTSPIKTSLTENFKDFHNLNFPLENEKNNKEFLAVEAKKRKEEKAAVESQVENEPEHKSKRRKSCRKNRYQGNFDADLLLNESNNNGEIAPANISTSAIQSHKKYPSSNNVNRSSSPKKAVKIEPIDDEDGHLIIRKNAMLSPRYTIVKLLGQGTFGKVVEAWDNVLQTRCAIKIIKAVQKYTDAAQVEIKVLKRIKENDPFLEKGCIHLNDYFLYQGHICMAFNLLSQSLYDFFQESHFAPFSIRQIQSFAQQIINSIVFLHDLRYIHTDLKPENLMLVNKEKVDVPLANSKKPRKMLKDTRVVLIDFGSTISQDDYHGSVVSTRHYRAPEILLDLGWSFPCDIWSIGCILVELYTGVALFQTHDNLEHLKMMEVILGPFPQSLIKHLSERNRFYFNDNGVNYPIPSTEKSSIQFVSSLLSIESIIRPRNDFEFLFLDFCRALLRFHPDERITAREAQVHAFLNY